MARSSAGNLRLGRQPVGFSMGRRKGLTFNAPMSLTINAHRRPWSFDLRMLDNSVVLPEPRKPESSVTGSRLSSDGSEVWGTSQAIAMVVGVQGQIVAAVAAGRA